MADRLTKDFETLHEARITSEVKTSISSEVKRQEIKIPGGFEIKTESVDVAEEGEDTFHLRRNLVDWQGSSFVQIKQMEVNGHKFLPDNIKVYVNKNFIEESILDNKENKIVMLKTGPTDILALCVLAHELGHTHNDPKINSIQSNAFDRINNFSKTIFNQVDRKLRKKTTGSSPSYSELWDSSFSHHSRDYRRRFYKAAVLGFFNGTKTEIETIRNEIQIFENTDQKNEASANHWMVNRLRELQKNPEDSNNKEILDSALNLLVTINQGSHKAGIAEDTDSYFANELSKVQLKQFNVGSRQKLIENTNFGLEYEKECSIITSHIKENKNGKYLKPNRDEVEKFLTESYMSNVSNILREAESKRFDNWQIVDRLDLSQEVWNPSFSEIPHRGDIVAISINSEKKYFLVNDNFALKRGCGEVECIVDSYWDKLTFSINEGELLITDDGIEIDKAKTFEVIRRQWSEEEIKQGESYLQMVLDTLYQGHHSLKKR